MAFDQYQRNVNEMFKFVDDGNDNPAVRVSNKAYDVGTSTWSVTESNPVLLLTTKVTLQDAITSAETSAAVDTTNFSKHTFQFEMSTSHTTVIQASANGTDWETIDYDMHGNDISSGSSADEIIQIEGKFKKMRVDTTAVSGALDVLYFGGN